MKARSRAKKAKAAKTRAQRPRIDPDKVKRLDDARRERRQKALAKVQGRIGRVAETVSGDLPVTKDAVTLIVGAAMRFLPPPSVELKIQMEDGEVVPISGAEARRIGQSLVETALIRSMLNSFVKTPAERADKPLCECGHTKGEHVREGLSVRCLGTETPLPGAPPQGALCHCRWYRPASPKSIAAP